MSNPLVWWEFMRSKKLKPHRHPQRGVVGQCFAPVRVDLAGAAMVLVYRMASICAFTDMFGAI